MGIFTLLFMHKMLPYRVFCAVIIVILSVSPLAYAVSPDENVEEAGESSPEPALREVGILLGYGDTSVTEKGTYSALPFVVRLGVDCDRYGLGFSDWIERGIRLFSGREVVIPGETTFLMEPFVSFVPEPQSNVEAGFVIALKYAYPLTDRLHPYLLGGGGVMYISQHLREQATQYNFCPQVGGGISWYLTPDTMFNLEYRYRHFSNAGLKEPNDGVNMDMVLAGVSFLY
ncbi:MAG: acyloxyacyl hydrolase [Candidatus Omnitrophica bacterium]|nr:acyloxyacyl hydrolase [Candidatus Omnitrophota bacterium]